MKGNDWKHIFGKADEEFLNQIDRTLDGLDGELAPRRRMRGQAALIAAALIVLMAGTALAMGGGLIGKLNGILDFSLPPEAEQLVESDLGGAQTDLFTLTVEQAVCDGQSALIQLCVVPDAGEGYEILYAESGEAYEVYDQAVPPEGRRIILFDTALSRIGGGGMEFNCVGVERYEDGSLRIWFAGQGEKSARDTQKLLVHFRWGVAGGFTRPDYATYTDGVKMWLPEDDEFRIVLERQAGAEYRLVPEGESEKGRFTLLAGSAVVTPLRTYLDFAYDRADADEGMYYLDVTDAQGQSLTDGGWRMSGRGELLRDGNLIYRVTDHIIRLDPVPDRIRVELKTPEGETIDRAALTVSPAE